MRHTTCKGILSHRTPETPLRRDIRNTAGVALVLEVNGARAVRVVVSSVCVMMGLQEHGKKREAFIRDHIHSI